MQSPQNGNFVKGNMLPVNHHVQDYHSQQYGRPIRERKQVQRPPTCLLCPHRRPDCNDREKKSNRQRINDNQPEIRTPTPRPCLHAVPRGEQSFQSPHEDEHAQENRQTNLSFSHVISVYSLSLASSTSASCGFMAGSFFHASYPPSRWVICVKPSWSMRFTAPWLLWPDLQCTI